MIAVISARLGLPPQEIGDHFAVAVSLRQVGNRSNQLSLKIGNVNILVVMRLLTLLNGRLPIVYAVTSIPMVYVINARG